MKETVEIDVYKLMRAGISANMYLILHYIHKGDTETLVKYLAAVGKPPISAFEEMKDAGYIELVDPEQRFKDNNVKVTSKFTDLFVGKTDNSEFETLFNELLEVYPKVVTEGLRKRRLQAEKANCKIIYKKLITSNDGINYALHKAIINSIKKEIQEKALSNSLIYMVELVRYLRNARWEPYMDDDISAPVSFKKII